MTVRSAPFGTAIIALVTSIPEVRAQAAQFLIWPVVMPLVAVWAYTYDGVYLAATRTGAGPWAGFSPV